MKRNTTSRIGLMGLCAMIATLGLTSVLAQPYGQDRPREGREDRMAARPLLEQWLERLSEEGPSEYERLMELKDQQPAAFREELRNHLHDARSMRRLRNAYPDLHQHLEQMPREERVRFRALLGEDPEARPGRHRRLSQEYLTEHEATREFVKEWRAAEDTDGRETARTALRNHLEELFDQRMEAQEEEIRRAEERVERLRSLLDERRDDRETWVDRILQRLLQEEDRRTREQHRMRRREP